MKQIQYRVFGPPHQVAEITDVADVGVPSAWEVVVDVDAFPINPADLAMLAGRYGKLPKLPAAIGMEAAGTVASVGSSVTNVAVGDRVVIIANNNWAERRKVPSSAVHRVSSSADSSRMCMLKVNPATALLLLNRLEELGEKDWLIQSAPLSSVGRCVIQLAKLKGLRTVNIVKSTEARAEVLTLGGDIAVEEGPDLSARVKAAVKNQPIRAAIDAIAGPGIHQLAECLADGARIMNYGMLSGERCVLGPEQTIFRKISLHGFWVSSVLNSLTLPERTQLFDTLAEAIESGTLKMDIDSQFAFKDIKAALRRAEERGRKGKVVVTVDR